MLRCYAVIYNPNRERGWESQLQDALDFVQREIRDGGSIHSITPFNAPSVWHERNKERITPCPAFMIIYDVSDEEG